MRYQIEAHNQDWAIPICNRTKSYDYSECHDHMGVISIDFAYRKKTRTYRNDFVNIPLFLTEIELFMNDLCALKEARWDLGFAPFAYGRILDSALLISSVSGPGFLENMYDEMSDRDVARLRGRIRGDMDKFGRVTLRPL